MMLGGRLGLALPGGVRLVLPDHRVLVEWDVVALQVVVEDPQQDPGAALVEHIDLQEIPREHGLAREDGWTT